MPALGFANWTPGGSFRRGGGSSADPAELSYMSGWWAFHAREDEAVFASRPCDIVPGVDNSQITTIGEHKAKVGDAVVVAGGGLGTEIVASVASPTQFGVARVATGTVSGTVQVPAISEMPNAGAFGASGDMAQSSAAAQPALRQEGGLFSIIADNAGTLFASSPGDIDDAEVGATVFQVIAITGPNDAIDRAWDVNAGGMLARVFVSSGSYFLANSSSVNLGAAAQDSQYRLMQVHWRRTSASTATYRARIGNAAETTGTFSMSSDATGAQAISSIYAMSSGTRQLNNAWCAHMALAQGDRVDDPAVVDWFESVLDSAATGGVIGPWTP